MTALAGPLYAFALLLAAAGVLKLIDPRATAGALQTTGFPSSFALVRILGLAEVAIGVGAIAVGGTWSSGLLSLSYLAFAGFVILARSRNLPIASCGCFGKDDTPPSAAHILLTVAAAGVGAAVAANPLGPLPDVLGEQSWSGIPFGAATIVAAYLAYLVLTVLARTMSMVATGSQHPGGRA